LEADRLFTQLVRDERALLLVEREYWSLAARDPEVRKRFATRRSALRKRFGEGIAARLATLGGAPLTTDPERIATIFLGLVSGLAQEKITEPRAVPDDLLGEAFVLIYSGLVARAQ